MNKNLGIYISNLADTNQLKDIAEAVNICTDNGMVKDCSLFFDNIGYNPFKIKCGMFNSTDLWNFSGRLITTSFSCTLTALKIVNNIDLYYYYGFEKNVNALSLISLLSNKVIPVSKSEEYQQDMYRKTGVRPRLFCNFIDLITSPE